MLGVLPPDLDSIELRTIGRQVVPIQAMFRPMAQLLVYRAALVYPGVVDQDDPGNLVRLSHYLVEERYCDGVKGISTEDPYNGQWTNSSASGTAYNRSFVPAPSTDVPEPASIALFAIGAAAFAYRRRRNQHS